jgi:hypothetical protein
MRRKCGTSRYVNAVKNFILIYAAFALVFLTLFSSGQIIQTASAGSYNGPDYYVNGSSGNDGNNGSFAHPWKTIQYAVDHTSSGNSINIMAGVYAPATGQIIIANKNTAGQWYTIKNYNNDRVVIDGTNCPTSVYINATIELKNSRYVHITGITVNHSAKGGITLMASPISFVSIDHCTISNSSSFAFKAVYGLNNITFEYNYVYNNFNDWSNTLMSQETLSFEHIITFSINHNTLRGNHAENIDMKGGCKYGSVCYNTINNTGGYVMKGGMATWGGPAIMIDSRGITQNVSIYNNNIYGNNSGISMNTEDTGHYEYIYVYNNVVNITAAGSAPTYNGRVGLLLSNTGYSTEMFHNIYFYSNTVRTGIGNTYNVFQIGHFSNNYLNSSNLRDVYVVNNIFCTAATTGTNILSINFISYEDGLIILNNNSYYRATGTLRCYWDGTYYYTSSPDKWGDEPLFTNPLFVNGADYNGNFHLASTSPCIDTGNSAIVSSFDFDGVSRPQGAGYDIGAYEYHTSGDTTPPVISSVGVATSNPLDTQVGYGWENFTSVVTDNVGVSTVILKITNPDQSTTNISMTKKTGTTMYYSNRSLSLPGNYSYVVKATDASNNSALSSSHLIFLPPNWDINGDGSVNILDIVLVSNQYGATGSSGWIREDVDNNGVINVLDINLVSNHYGQN